MSVLKNKRNLSKLEFYHNARKMRRGLTGLLLRDFGVHSRKNKVLINEGLPDDYYAEFIQKFFDDIFLLLRNLVLNITAGNSIYPTTLAQVERRRQFQEAAIINCEQLHQEFLYCADVLPVKAATFVPYVEMVNYEITLLRGWKKSSNKFETIIIEKGGGTK